MQPNERPYQKASSGHLVSGINLILHFFFLVTINMPFVFLFYCICVMLLVDVIPRRYNEEFKNVKILVSVILVFTLANCDWHFLDVIVGSVPL